MHGATSGAEPAEGHCEEERAGKGFSNAERVAVVALLLLGAWLRLRHVGSAFLFGDEMHSLRLLSLPYRQIIAAYDSLGSGLALPLLQKVSVDLFGESLAVLRLPALLPALGTLALLPLLGRQVISRGGTLFATALLAASSMAVFYARFGRSYSLVVLLALVFVVAATRVLAEGRPGLRPYALLALTGGLLPWAHLASAPFVATVGGAALAAAVLARRGWDRILPLLGALAIAAGVALLLHLPSWENVTRFVTAKEHEETPGTFGWVDVATVLAGGHAGGILLLAAVPLAAAFVMWRHGLSHLPLATAAVATLPLVFLMHPRSNAYSYARYSVAVLAPAVLVVGELLSAVCAAAGASAVRAIPLLAVLLGGALAVAGPLGMTDDGPYANTYLAITPLPAFDAPDPAMSELYRRLEPNAVIVEAPALVNRSRQLYRNYFLQHRHATLIGFVPEDGPAPPGPHVAVGPPWDLDERADYLVLHRDIGAEIDRYWRFVYEDALPRLPGKAGLMDRQATVGGPSLRPTNPRLVEALTRRYGAPVYADGAIIVYRLRKSR